MVYVIAIELAQVASFTHAREETQTLQLNWGWRLKLLAFLLPIAVMGFTFIFSPGYRADAKRPRVLHPA